MGACWGGASVIADSHNVSDALAVKLSGQSPTSSRNSTNGAGDCRCIERAGDPDGARG